MVIAILTAKCIALVLRLLGKGATTLPGKIALKLKYNILTKLSESVTVICVTGTNGKTTTCALLEHVLQREGCSYFINKSGANMMSGVTTAFIMNATVFGKCKKDYAILECDENSLPLIANYLDAHIIAVTNLFRDQLDRYGEISHTRQKIKEAIDKTPTALLLLNADDPITYSLAAQCRNRTVTFGINADIPSGGISDMRYCPVCGNALAYQSRVYAQLGNYRCSSCGFHRPAPDIAISDITATGFILHTKRKSELAATSLGGLYNLYNYCAAAAILDTLGFPSLSALGSFSGAFGRMEKFTCNGKTVLLLLVKNPVGLTGCIRYVCQIRGAVDMAFALNDNEADGRDVSWIWDSDFTPIAVKNPHVYTLGTRSEDMALRLKYDGIQTDKIIDGEGFRELLDIIKSSDSDFIVFSTYTAMMHMRHLFIDCFGGREFWE